MDKTLHRFMSLLCLSQDDSVPIFPCSKDSDAADFKTILDSYLSKGMPTVGFCTFEDR